MSDMKKARTLIIFDVDGTLIDATEIDNDCFDRAFQETTGVTLTASIWSQFKEVTAQAIVLQALGDAWPDVASTLIALKSPSSLNFVQDML
jgi:beta-phosphoglucomutase-like phosphatase (HAD superfamily)